MTCNTMTANITSLSGCQAHLERNLLTIAESKIISLRDGVARERGQHSEPIDTEEKNVLGEGAAFCF
jgi:hypothetical protein